MIKTNINELSNKLLSRAVKKVTSDFHENWIKNDIINICKNAYEKLDDDKRYIRTHLSLGMIHNTLENHQRYVLGYINCLYNKGIITLEEKDAFRCLPADEILKIFYPIKDMESKEGDK